MVVNRKVTGKTSSMPAGLAMGAAISLGITLILASAIAKLVSSEKLAEEHIGYGVMVLLFVASAVGAATANSRIKRRRLLVSCLAGLTYMGILLSITALFFGGQYEAVGVTALLVMGGSICATLIGIDSKRGGHRKKGKKYHR